MLIDNRAEAMKKARKLAVLLGVLLLITLAIYVAQRSPDIRNLARFGYPGVAILMFLSSGTVLLPAPGFAAVLAAGTIWNPVLVGIAAGIGAGTGEISGYLLGIGGNTVLDLKEGKRWRRAHGWLEKHGLLAILILAAIPNPFFDAIGLVAGSLAYPIRSFWIAAVLGNSIKYVLLAWLSGSAVAWWAVH
ncbi:MAG: DedA family protein [Chloroflexota bacterium]